MLTVNIKRRAKLAAGRPPKASAIERRAEWKWRRSAFAGHQIVDIASGQFGELGDQIMRQQRAAFVFFVALKRYPSKSAITAYVDPIASRASCNPRSYGTPRKDADLARASAPPGGPRTSFPRRSWVAESVGEGAPYFHQAPAPSDDWPTGMEERISELGALDRYERCALSSRNSAIRRFDARRGLSGHARRALITPSI